MTGGLVGSPLVESLDLTKFLILILNECKDSFLLILGSQPE